MLRDVEQARIWVLEDSALEAEMLRRSLAPLGHVNLFSEGHSVLEELANDVTPDVLVLDWQLPNLSGIEMCRFIREREEWSKIPILMLTMHGRKQEIVAALDAGANDYLTKPFDVTELLARVRTLARQSRLQLAELRRSRQYRLVAEVGSALTRARTVHAMEHGVVAAILAHAGVTEVRVVAAGSDAIPHELARRALEGWAPVEEVVAGRHHAVFPLGSVPQAFGVLVVSDARPLPAHVTADLGRVADMLSLGMARLHAEAASADALERERLARAEAEAANASKDDFLAMVSHELRTPLNAILGWTELLGVADVRMERVRHGLTVIERNARSQAQLIDDLLDISRIISGKLSLEVARVEFGALVEIVTENARPAATAKNVEIRLETERGVGLEVSGDAHRLQQIVWNLVSNAVKFTEAGGRVTIRVCRIGETISLVVEDTGRGIEPTFLPHVFERYRQADMSSRREKSGLGLGLAIASHLAELHAGRLEAASDGLQKGATFTLTLPTASRADRIQRRGESARPAPADELVRRHIVIVEDDADARELLGVLLRRYGATVEAASCVADGLELIRASQPDLVISDIAMPGEDGYSLIRRLRALPPEEGGRVMAIALTAFARPSDRVAALRAGFHAHVAKPVDATELVAVARSLIDTKP